MIDLNEKPKIYDSECDYLGFGISATSFSKRSKGVHPKVNERAFRHSQISINLDTYSHVLPTMQKDAVGKIYEALDDED